MRSIRELDIEGKRVLIRVDFIVPMDESGNITDDIRIRMSIEKKSFFFNGSLF